MLGLVLELQRALAPGFQYRQHFLHSISAQPAGIGRALLLLATNPKGGGHSVKGPSQNILKENFRGVKC